MHNLKNLVLESLIFYKNCCFFTVVITKTFKIPFRGSKCDLGSQNWNLYILLGHPVFRESIILTDCTQNFLQNSLGSNPYPSKHNNGFIEAKSDLKVDIS